MSEQGGTQDPSDQLRKDENTRQSGGMWRKAITRRDVLKLAGIGGAGLLLGSLGTGGILQAGSAPVKREAQDLAGSGVVDFYGAHQAGIATPPQDFVCFAAFDLTVDAVAQVRKLFQQWTEAAAVMTSGGMIGSSNDNPNLPPSDTGEAAELVPSGLTITFGVGPSLFDARYGLSAKKPDTFADLPAFSGDELRPEWTGGDIGIQVCANDLQVAFHAIRNLARIARGKAVLRWTQEGFQRSSHSDKAGATPRNLMGFKDGTVNPNVHDPKTMDEVVWAQADDGVPWMAGGSYMVVRRVRIRVEVWDRSTLQDQEATFGRHRRSGAPLGSRDEFDQVDLNAKDENGNPLIPMNAHVRLARGDNSVHLLRRSYSYSSGLDRTTGQLDAGLLFISYQRDIAKQFIPVQKRLASDKLNEYIVHNGSAVFACFPGVREGGYIGDTLL